MTRAPLGVAKTVLLRPDQAFDHRIHGFEMTGIERDRNQNFFARGGGVHAARAEMVFHVAGALHAIRVGLTFEFGENLRHRFTNHVGEHVQPAAMRHADDGFVHVLVGGALQNFVEDHDGACQSFEPEALLADKAGLQEVFELFRLDQAVQDALPHRIVELPKVHSRFHAVLQPLLLLRILNMHVFDADEPQYVDRSRSKFHASVSYGCM